MSVNSALAQLFFPQRHCLLCGCLCGRPGLCPSCEEKQRALGQCALCAAFLPKEGICLHCLAKRPAFTLARAAWPYRGALRDHLRGFKYQEQTWLRRPLALLMLNAYQQHYAKIHIDAVIPAPLSARRRQERGYNQSQLLSRLIAAELGLAHQPGLLCRRLDTPPLHTYDGKQRLALLKDAYEAKPKVAGKAILLVDDIYTSGATMKSCAAALLAQGAQEVYGLAAAGPEGNWQK